MADEEFPAEGIFERTPVLVQAKQYNGTTERAYELLTWVHHHGGKGWLEDGSKDQGPDLLYIKVSVGEPRLVQDHFWVLRCVDENKFQVWADDSFRQMFRVPKEMSEWQHR